MEWEYKVVHIAIEASWFLLRPKASNQYEKILNYCASDGWGLM